MNNKRFLLHGAAAVAGGIILRDCIVYIEKLAWKLIPSKTKGSGEKKKVYISKEYNIRKREF